MERKGISPLSFHYSCTITHVQKANEQKIEKEKPEKTLKDEFYVNPESETEEWTPGK